MSSDQNIMNGIEELIDHNANRLEALLKLVEKIHGVVRVLPIQFVDSRGRFTFLLETSHEMKRSLYVLERLLGPPDHEAPVGEDRIKNCTKWIIDNQTEMTRYVKLHRFPTCAEIEVSDVVIGFSWSTLTNTEIDLEADAMAVLAEELAHAIDNQIMNSFFLRFQNLP